MEQVLLWVSLVVGVVLFLCRFLPVAPERGANLSARVESVAAPTSPLRGIAFVVPFLGLLATLPVSAPFHAGQKLGLGFFAGGIAAWGAGAFWKSRRNTQDDIPPFVRLAVSYGASVFSVALALLFMRQSLMDALLGVALGGFCAYFALYLDTPRSARAREGAMLADGAGLLAALCAGVGLAVLRDAVTPDLPKLAWASVLLSFAALGTVLGFGASLLGRGNGSRRGAAQLAPLGVLVVLGGGILYLLSQKITNSSPLFLPGIAGLLLWPVALAVIREGRRSAPAPDAVRPALLVAALLIVTGFLASVQMMQGMGAAVGVVALFLAHLATLGFGDGGQKSQTGDATAAQSSPKTSLLFLAALLLLWRFFGARWAGELRGAGLTDQYALFGLLIGAALPRLLSSLPERFGGGKAAAWGTLLFSLVTVLACPAAVLALFGAKSAVALLIGLAVGVLPLAAPNLSAFPGFFALAISLVLAQFTGRAIPLHAPTRMEKIRVLLVIMAGVVVAVIAAQTANRGAGAAEESK